MPMTNEEYARRVARIMSKIQAWYPWPETEYDNDTGTWNRMMYLRSRAERRIRGLPAFWTRKVKR